MTYKTHLALAYAINIPLIEKFYEAQDFNQNSVILALIITFILSLAPDLDHPKSFLSQIPPFNIISWILSSITNHRGITHRFYFIFIPTFLIWFGLTYLNIKYKIDIKSIDNLTLLAFLAYLSHLLGDCTTKSGIKGLFSPFYNKTVYIVPKFMRYKTGTIVEYFYLLGLIFIIVFEVKDFLLK